MPLDRRTFLKTAGAAIALPAIGSSAWAKTPDAVSLEQYQTGYRNQRGRSTCYAFGTCAAIEAAYKRKYGLDLHLSEQYAFHVNKVFELFPSYLTDRSILHENNSSYWGYQGNAGLVSKLAVCAIPEASAAPYLPGARMKALKAATPACGDLDVKSSTQEQLDAFEFLETHIPMAARYAARYRVAGFAELPRNPSESQIESVLAGGREVITAVFGGSHIVLLIGYDRPKRLWLVKNSGGEGKPVLWPYEKAKIVQAAYVTGVTPPDAPPQKDAWWIGRWHMNHDGHLGELVIRRTIDFRQPNGPTKLGNYYARGKRFDVNGSTIDGGQGLRFWIADTQDRVKPGERRGQEFTVYAFSSDPYNAAGLMTGGSVPFGVKLSRNEIAVKPSRHFSADAWRGDWNVSCDGVRGTLSLASVAPVKGSYRTDRGETLAVRGSLNAARPHLLDLQIAGSGGDRLLHLAFHGQEDDVFSGITAWKGRNLGVSGARLAA
jgi:TAT (twin-arginine translocation) pathway signal sequence